MKSVEAQPPLPSSEQVAKESLIRRLVLASLGTPRDLFGVRVNRLWDNCYRVNVLTGIDLTSTSVSASYFITTDEAGNILRSDPAISQRS